MKQIMNIPFTDAFCVRTPFGKRVKYKDFPKTLIRSGVVAHASIFQISSYNIFQYAIQLIKEMLC